jgi:uncharacterized membrane protein YcjF (UPF0283 family)
MIIIGLIFIVLGFGVKYAKMYYLIAGYNTMPAAEKAKINIKAVAALFWNVFGSLGVVLIVSELLMDYFNREEFGYIQLPAILIAILWILIRSNSMIYRIGR